MELEQRVETAVVFDAAPLDDLLELLGEDGSLIVGEVLGAYLLEAPQLVARIDDGVRTGNLVTIRDAAHTLKSASVNVGAIALSQRSDRAELAARAGDADEALEHCRAIRPLFEATVERIERWRE